MFETQSFRTQNRVLLARNARDGYVPRASHKSLLFPNVSARVPLRVLSEDGAEGTRLGLPPMRTALVCPEDCHLHLKEKGKKLSPLPGLMISGTAF